MAIDWPQLRPVKEQSLAFRSKARFICLLAGRGSGKSEIAKRKVVRSLALAGGGIYAYALPTYAQAQRVAWKDFKRLIPKEWIKKASDSSLTIETIFGTTLVLLGMDKAERAEGVQYRGVVIDECSDQKPGTISKTFIPALTAFNGWLWAIGVPKSYGRGAIEYKQYCQHGFKKEKGWETYHWSSKKVLTGEQMRVTADMMDAKTFSELMDAVWGETGGGVYHAFSEHVNVPEAGVKYNPDLPILVGSDFNVDPMAWVLCQKIDTTLHVFDEIWLRNTNTQNTLDYLWDKYGTHRSGWAWFGDASGKARRSSATSSDYVQIITDTRFDEFTPKEVYYPRANPAVADRLAATNARLRSKSGVPRTFIDKSCKNLINDLRARSYKPGTRDLDDSGDIGHITDALGYVIHRLWPMIASPADSDQTIYTT